MMNTINRLILNHLNAAGGYQIPEETLKSELCILTRPATTQEQWDDAIIELLQRDLIGFTRDEVDDSKKFYIKEKGQTALRR